MTKIKSAKKPKALFILLLIASLGLIGVLASASNAWAKIVTVLDQAADTAYFPGKVGVGLTGPTEKLEVNGYLNTPLNTGGYKTNTNLVLAQKDALGGVGVGFIDYYSRIIFDNANSGTLHFQAGNAIAERMTVRGDSGYIGIGTTAPTKLLDLNGDALINGMTLGRGAGNVSGNTAFGINALASNSTGYANMAIGENSLYSNTTGHWNVADGSTALYSNTTGHFNTAVGKDAGRRISAGTGNTNPTYGVFIGVDSRALTDNDTNEIVIGSNAIGNGTNSVTLGDDTITKTILKGNVGIGTTSPQYKLDVYGTGSFNQPVIVGAPTDASHATTKNYVDSLFASPAGSNWALNGSNLYASSTSWKVGIGTTAPSNKLSIVNEETTAAAALNITSYYNGAQATGQTVNRIARGTAAAPSAVQADDIMGGFAGRGYGATAFSSGRVQIIGAAAENFTDSAQGTYIKFSTTPLSSTTLTEAMRIDSAGNVGIGTAVPANKLSVNGDAYISSTLYSDGAIVARGGISDDLRSYLDIEGGTSSHTYFRGNIGIGTTAPTAAVHTTSLLASSGVTFSLLGGSGQMMVVTDNSGTLSTRAIPSIPSGTNGDTLRYNSGWIANSFLYNNGSRVGIGTTNPQARLDIVGGADETQLLIRANSTQTSAHPLMGFVDSTGYPLLTISADCSSNILIGVNAGAGFSVCSPVNSIFIGRDAGRYVSTGSGNIAVGLETLYSVGAGLQNVAVGHQALSLNSISQTTAVGYEAGINGTGSYSTYIGYLAGAAAGSYNTALGAEAGKASGTTNNVFIGYQSGRDISGSGNVTIGYRAGYNQTSLSNKLIIDNDGSGALIYGDFSANKVAIATSTGSYTLSVGGGVQASAYYYWSDRNMKKDIKPLNDSLHRVLQLQGVSYKWKDNPEETGTQIGLIAQDVAKVFPEVVSQGEPKSIQYGNLVAPLVEAIKEQQRQIDNLEARIRILEMKK